MPFHLVVEVHESADVLQSLFRKSSPALKPRIKMLIALSKGITRVNDLAAKTGASAVSICNWKKKYHQGGLEALLQEGRGGDKRSGISAEQKQKIASKLREPKDAFRSYVEAQTWLREEMGICKEYHALNKYLKRNFGAKLKVGRKSHVKKDDAAVAVFKKPA